MPRHKFVLSSRVLWAGQRQERQWQKTPYYRGQSGPAARGDGDGCQCGRRGRGARSAATVGRATPGSPDTKCPNHALYAWVADNGWYDVEIVRRPKDAEGWVVLPIRWTVERTFAWLNKCRRLSVDREKSILSAEAMIRLARHKSFDRWRNIMRWITLTAVLLVAAPAPPQENEAEKLFRSMEKSPLRAKTAEIVFEGAAKGSGDFKVTPEGECRP